MPWPTIDPFLFCVYHQDDYPAGNELMHPKASLVNRNIGADFSGLDGWSMYHGHRVPGFPQHPHRGFETISIIKRGFIDHSDSLRATARIGPGDVQWMTAGRGIVHCEMFPLIEESAPNPTEFFQLWLNLPARDKMTDPRFTMFWDEDVPQFHHQDANGCISNGRVIAGSFFGHTPPPHPPLHGPLIRQLIWESSLSQCNQEPA